MAMKSYPLIPLSYVGLPGETMYFELPDRDFTNFLCEENEKGNRYVGAFFKKNYSGQLNDTSKSDFYVVGNLVEFSIEEIDGKRKVKAKYDRRILLKDILRRPPSELRQSDHELAAHSGHSQNDQSEFQGEVNVTSASEKFPRAQTEDLKDEDDSKPEELEALKQHIKKMIQDFSPSDGSGLYILDEQKSCAHIAYELTSKTSVDPYNKQLVLEENKVERRLRLASLLLELWLLHQDRNQMQNNAYKNMEKKINDIEVNAAYPENVKYAAKQVKNKYEEFTKCEKYLELLMSFPWDHHSEEIFDVDHARRTLNEDLIGLEDVKNRILAFINMAQTATTTNGMTLYIHGPRCVGKKSIGKAIARALQRKFFIVDLESCCNIADLLGQDCLSDGGRPGNIIKGLLETRTMNPVVLLYGVDAVWRRQEEIFCNALRRILYWNERTHFQDNYLGISVDLSKVLFVCIASDINNIPPTLGFKIYEVKVTAEYFLFEKLAIARRFLIPAVYRLLKIPADQILIDDSAVKELVLEYCTMLGAYHLNWMVERIAKAKKQAIDEGRNDLSSVNVLNLKSYFSEPKRHRVYKETPIGVVRGLAFNQLASCPVYIEALAVPGEGPNVYTGTLGETFKESIEVATSFGKAVIYIISQGRASVFQNSKLHIHATLAAEPKDGPSAGIAIVTALMSLFLQKSVPQNMAMTGEVTLTGSVQKVGGIRQKMIAAEKEGITCIILPEANRDDYEKLPEEFREDRTVHFVTHCKQVFKIVFPDYILYWNSL